MKVSFNSQVKILPYKNCINKRSYTVNPMAKDDRDCFTPSFKGTGSIESTELKFVNEYGTPEQRKFVKQIYKIKSQLQYELTDRLAIYAKDQKTNVQIPNAIMLIDENNSSESLIDWAGETVVKE